MNKKKAIAVITNKTIKKLNGYILFEEVDKKTKITINLTGLPKGKHGFHIHKSGDLRDSCKSLCGHYNPYNKNHGDINDKERHVGDLGNIEPNSKGFCKKIIYDKLVKLKGKYSVIGRSIVIHSNKDDLGKGNNKASLITGNAGKRIGCGVIGII